MELGTPGRAICAPTAGGLLLMSMGTNGMIDPVGGGKKLAAYTVVVFGLVPFTETLNTLL